MEMVKTGAQTEFRLHDDGLLRFRGRICVPKNTKLKEEIMGEVHGSAYTVHPGGTKMYHDLKKNLWWNGMKRDITHYVAQCFVCQ